MHMFPASYFVRGYQQIFAFLSSERLSSPKLKFFLRRSWQQKKTQALVRPRQNNIDTIYGSLLNIHTCSFFVRSTLYSLGINVINVQVSAAVIRSSEGPMQNILSVSMYLATYKECRDDFIFIVIIIGSC
jgi:hypothetical protein